MANIEEYRASLTAKRNLAQRMAEHTKATYERNGHPGLLSQTAYHRGYVQGLERALAMLDDVDGLPEGWEPPPNLERDA